MMIFANELICLNYDLSDYWIDYDFPMRLIRVYHSIIFITVQTILRVNHSQKSPDSIANTYFPLDRVATCAGIEACLVERSIDLRVNG